MNSLKQILKEITEQNSLFKMTRSYKAFKYLKDDTLESFGNVEKLAKKLKGDLNFGIGYKDEPYWEIKNIKVKNTTNGQAGPYVGGKPFEDLDIEISRKTKGGDIILSFNNGGNVSSEAVDILRNAAKNLYTDIKLSAVHTVDSVKLGDDFDMRNKNYKSFESNIQKFIKDGLAKSYPRYDEQFIKDW